MDMPGLKGTPLFDFHRRYRARLVEFAGWEMPVQYESIIKEHLAVREKAGLFDVSHMGEIAVRGKASWEGGFGSIFAEFEAIDRKCVCELSSWWRIGGRSSGKPYSVTDELNENYIQVIHTVESCIQKIYGKELTKI